MSSNGTVPEPSATRRPVISDLETGPAGRQFTITFEPGQQLPPHRNAARVVITAVHGSGEITIGGDGVRGLPRGAFVQLEPQVEHSVVAGNQGLELLVQLVANCCEHC